MIIGYLSFGRVPGCLDLGALFLCGGGTNGGTNGQSGFLGCEVWWSDGRVVGHQRCAGWLQGLSFLVVCWEGVGYQRCVGWLQGLSFLVVSREGVGIGAVVDAVE